MKKKTTYILIDASASMQGLCADAVNVAIKEVIEGIVSKVMNQKDADIEPYLAVLTFKANTFEPYDEKNIILEWVIPKCRMEEVGEWVNLDQGCFSGGTPARKAIEKVIRNINIGCSEGDDPDDFPPTILMLSNEETNRDFLLHIVQK